MARPEEVLVVENEHGEVVREFMKDTDSINLYKNMRETLVYLTHLDYVDTERIMSEKLQNQVNGSEWSWKNLNTLCWAIGSISGAMHEEDEKRFLVTVIKELLGLCEQKKGKDNKAIIASNIMYVVGQYPRFLRAHWKFLKTVVNKLFEFMHETHDGVQDMACDTFAKIAKNNGKHFVNIHVREDKVSLSYILNSINSLISDLQSRQRLRFYEAIGVLIAAMIDQVQTSPMLSENEQGMVQINVMTAYLFLSNEEWDNIVLQVSKNFDVLKQPSILERIVQILKINTRSRTIFGIKFTSQLSRMYQNLSTIYLKENPDQSL
jgi:exportin-1